MVTGQPYRETARSQLERLAMLTDVVYAVALVLIIQWLPMPEESHAEGTVWLVDLFVEYSSNIVAVLIGLVFVVMYWLRSNTLLTALDRTDSVHTGFSIASVFFLLFLLYIVRISGEVAGPSRRAGESVAVARIGLMAAAAWWHARRRGLVREGLSKEDRVGIQVEAFTEPAAALVTLPFAYVGELAWNLAWFSLIPLAAILRRRARREE
jgi:uncharacterized membrane protein